MTKHAKKNLILRMIKEKCVSDGIMQKQVCLGLCDPAYISRCITKNVEMDKLMLDAIMQRLGMSTRNYEYILRDSEYKCFELREKIRMCIQNNQLREANQLIEQYIASQSTMKGAKKLHLQMALLLHSYILAQKNEDLFIQMKNVEEALTHSLPMDYCLKLETLLFSEAELLLLTRKAMILEQMERREEAYDLYYKLFQRQMCKPYDNGELIHVFAVVDYHLSKLCLKIGQYDLAKRAAKVGVDTLSKKNKILFVAELYEIIKLVEGLGEMDDDRNKKRYDSQAFSRILRKYKANWHPNHYLPLYREYEVYSFRKMIVQRRKLIGITQEKLSELCCCDKSTIERMERGLVDTQCDVGYHILDILGLPIEKSFSLLQTDSYEVKEKFFQSTIAVNNDKLEYAKMLCQEIKEKIDMSLSTNRQAIELLEFLVFSKKSDISLDFKLAKLIKLLQYTLFLEKVEKNDSVAIYASEIDLIYHIAKCYEKNDESEKAILLLEMIRKAFSDKDVVGEEFIDRYFIFTNLEESISANISNFEYANKMIEECLPKIINHDIAGWYPHFIYDKIWNKVEEGKILNQHDYEELKDAYIVAVFLNEEKILNYINRLLEKIRNEIICS